MASPVLCVHCRRARLPALPVACIQVESVWSCPPGSGVTSDLFFFCFFCGLYPPPGITPRGEFRHEDTRGQPCAQGCQCCQV